MMSILNILYQAAYEWLRTDMGYYTAAFSYYAPLALIPLVTLSLFVSGLFYGADFVKNIFLDWGTVFGSDLLMLIEVAVSNLNLEVRSFQVPILAALFFIMISVFAFNLLGTGFRRIWNVDAHGWAAWRAQSLRSAFFILFLQAYLVVLIGAEGLLTYFSVPALSFIPTITWIIFVAGVFFMLFRTLVHPGPGRYACAIGALTSSLLFVASKSIVVIYLTAKPVLTIFGAAGLMLVLLIWVYVLAAITYYGALVAHLVDRERNDHIV